jgi:hypothetical protein
VKWLLRRPIATFAAEQILSSACYPEKDSYLGRKSARFRCISDNAGFCAASQRRRLIMTTRSRRETVTFKHSFRIRGIDRLLSAGAYEVITDEEMIEGLSFASFRRVATMIMVPAAAAGNSTMEMVSISSIDLSDAQRIDASASRE